MKKIALRKQMTSLLLGISAIAMPLPTHAAAPSQMDECAKELLLSYFPEQFVNETLSQYNIPKDKWAGINQTLSARDKEIIKLVEEKAAQVNPNPLKDPQQRQAAVKLFRETLLQVFSDAMKANGITDEQNFQAMLDDIQKQKAKKFAQCMQKQRDDQRSQQLSLSRNVKDDNNDDEDDEGEDDDDNDDDNDRR